jgi:hypothetical protein
MGMGVVDQTQLIQMQMMQAMVRLHLPSDRAIFPLTLYLYRHNNNNSKPRLRCSNRPL